MKTVFHLIMFVILTCFALSSYATDYTATSCQNTVASPHVQNCIDGLSPCVGITAGDTVIMPTGNCSWTTPVTISTSIKLKGASQTGTVLIDNLNRTTSIAMINIITSTGLTEVSYFTIDGNNNIGVNGSRFFDISGTGTTWHIGHITFTAYENQRFAVVYAKKGLIDWLTGTATFPNGTGAIYVWNGWQTGNRSDIVWSEPQALGTDNALYIEKCTWTSTFVPPPTGMPWAIDGWIGARVVFRRNTLTNVWIATHGTESAQHQRGFRMFEILDNTANYTQSWGQFVDIRSGSGVVRGNTVTGADVSYFISEANDRLITPFAPWGHADGVNVWDNNDATTYATGTHAGPNDTQTLTVSPSPGWTPDIWVGYSLRDTTSGKSGLIVDNSANTIDVNHQVNNPAGQPNWQTGEGFAINRVIASLDQAGHGQGDLLGGPAEAPINTVFGVAQWPRATIEGIYIWENTFKGSAVTSANIAATDLTLFLQNREWFLTAKSGYVEYQYPHPLATSGQTPPTIHRKRHSR